MLYVNYCPIVKDTYVRECELISGKITLIRCTSKPELLTCAESNGQLPKYDNMTDVLSIGI